MADDEMNQAPTSADTLLIGIFLGPGGKRRMVGSLSVVDALKVLADMQVDLWREYIQAMVAKGPAGAAIRVVPPSAMPPPLVRGG